MNFSKSLLAGVALLFASSAAMGASFDKERVLKRDVNVKQIMRRMAPNADISSSPRMQRINNVNKRMSGAIAADGRFARAMAPRLDATAPDKTFGPYSNFTDIDGPNGELWYYTATLKSKTVQYEYYSDEVLQEYQFDIYDSNFELVGSIHDKMRYAEDEVGVPGPLSGIDILPVITKNYFNGDDKYEVVVSIAVNTIYPGYNRYRSVVYSIDGEKEDVTIERDGKEVTVNVDKPVTQYDAFIVNVLNASNGSEENFYLTFSADIYNNGEAVLADDFYDEDGSYWEQLSTVGSSYWMYSKADAEGHLTEVFNSYLPYIQMQGDQQNTPPMMTFVRDGVSYLLYPYYREPYFNQVNDYYEDLTMREGNSLIIELYKLAPTGAELFTKTEIPVEKLEVEGLLGNYYSVGELGYSHDVSFDENGKPLYVIGRSNYLAGQDDVTGFCFYVYDADGNVKKTIFEGADSDLSLSSVPGFNDQHMFVSYDDINGYMYNMVDLSEGYSEKTVKLSYLLDTGSDDPDVLLFNMDRVAVGDSYKYAFELRMPVVDEDDNTYMRIAWFNADGTFDRIDNLNMGQRVQYAQSYMNGPALSPYLFNKDDAHEYMVLVKRGTSNLTSESQEELMVIQPTDEDYVGGKTVLHVVPSLEKGMLSTIGLYPGAKVDDSRLMIGYLNYDDYSYTVDFYNLPFDTTGIEEIVADGPDSQSEISFNGSSLAAKGLDIKVYNANGLLVASGKDVLAVDMLPAGLYVAAAGKSVNKFVIK